MLSPNDIIIQPAPTSQANPQEEAELLRKQIIPFLEQELKKAQRKLKVLLGET